MNKSVPSVSVKYAANGSSNKSNELDMRAMQNAALASRVIRATLVAGLIRKADADRPRPCCICTGMGVTWKTFDRVLIAQTQTRGAIWKVTINQTVTSAMVQHYYLIGF